MNLPKTTNKRVGKLPLLGVCIWSLISVGHLTASDTFNNPLLASGPDPWVTQHDGAYYYLKSGPRSSIILMRTTDITDLNNAFAKTIWKAPTAPRIGFCITPTTVQPMGAA